MGIKLRNSECMVLDLRLFLYFCILKDNHITIDKYNLMNKMKASKQWQKVRMNGNQIRTKWFSCICLFKHPYFILVFKTIDAFLTKCQIWTNLNEINHLHRIFVGWVLFAARCIFTTKYGLCDVWLRWSILAWCRDWHLPDTDCVVTVTGEQGLAIGRPGEWQTLWWIGLRCLRNNFWTKLFDGFLACQIL